MAPANDPLDALRLEEPAQLALAVGYLHLMEAELGPQPEVAAFDLVHEFRGTLADGPLGPRVDSGKLAVEADPEQWEDVLAAAANTVQCLMALVELCAAQPFADLDQTLEEKSRDRSLGEVAISLGGDVDEDDIEIIDDFLREGQQASKSQTMKWVLLGLGGVVGIATGGLAAPAIGAAIGGTMGLSGAAAAAAGLATLGGGSLAAGGLGMAGGTIVVAAAAGLAGAGVGGLAGSGISPKRLEVEAIKLFALVRTVEAHLERGHLEFDEDLHQMPDLGRNALRRLSQRLGGDSAQAERDANWERVVELDGARAAVDRLRRRLEA